MTEFYVVSDHHIMSLEKLCSQATSVAAEKHSKQTDKVIQYGTAGFRTKYAIEQILVSFIH